MPMPAIAFAESAARDQPYLLPDDISDRFTHGQFFERLTGSQTLHHRTELRCPEISCASVRNNRDSVSLIRSFVVRTASPIMVKLR